MRRQDIERRLSNSYNNLNIFLQRISEVERMLHPLAKQAEKTKRYNELYGLLKNAEINLYIYKHDNAASARASIHAMLDSLQAAIDAGREEVERLETQYEEDRRKVSESDALLQQLNESILKYTVDLEKKEGDVKVLRERIGFFREQRENSEKFIEMLCYGCLAL